MPGHVHQVWAGDSTEGRQRARLVCRGTTATERSTRGSTLSTIIAIDTETTSLRPDRRIWEIGLIVSGDLRGRLPVGTEPAEVVAGMRSVRWFVDRVDLELGNADPFALKVGGFYDRHPQMNPNTGGHAVSEAKMLHGVERITRGAHLLGAVPNFDADVLDRRMRAHGIAPSWHYHLIDIEAMVVGYLHGLRGTADRLTAAGIREAVGSLPWKSDDLSRACGVEPPSEDERHTALGDAAWALRLYEAITGGKP